MIKKQINPKDVYDKKALFEQDCRELLDELILYCSIHRIPFFWTAAVKNSTEGTEYIGGSKEEFSEEKQGETTSGTEYISDAVGPASRKIILADDKISKHLGVAAGFDIVPSRDELEIFMEDISPDFEEEEA